MIRYAFLFLTFILCGLWSTQAHFAIFQVSSDVPAAITYDITSAPFNGTCNGQLATATLTITSGNNHLSSTTPLWVPGDVGKYIAVGGASNDASVAFVLLATISTVTDATHLILSSNATATISASSQLIEWGNDDIPAFGVFITTALTWQNTHSGLIQLNIPSGRCLFVTNATGKTFTAGLKQFRLVGYGGVLSAMLGSGSGFFLGAGVNGSAPKLCPTNCVKVATVSAGLSAVTILDAAKASLFTAGDWALIAGVDTQGFGSPPNPGVFEYVKILSIVGTTITFTSPLTYAYKSTWPEYDPSQYGPATLVALDQDWDTSQEYRGVGISTGPFGTNAAGRNITFRDVTAQQAMVTPTVNQTLNWNNVSVPNQLVEWDKIISTVNLTNGGTYRQFQFQNSSPLSMIMSGGHITQSMNGSPQRFVGSNITVDVDWDIGPSCCGYGQSFSCTSCVISGNISGTSKGVITSHVTDAYTMASGVIKLPNVVPLNGATNNGSGAIRISVAAADSTHPGTAGFTTGKYTSVSCTACGVAALVGNGFTGTITVIDGTHIDLVGSTFSGSYTSGGNIGIGSQIWAVPGANIIWTGQYDSELVTKITDMSQDVTFTYVTTNLAGGFPSTIPTSGGNLGLRLLPVVSFSCSLCSGGVDAVDLAQAGAQGKPLWSYSKRVITSTNGNPSTAAVIPMMGAIQNLNVTVNTAYTGSSLSFQIGVGGAFVLNGTTTAQIYAPTFNTKLTGSRLITPTTTSGLQSGDSVSAPGNGTWYLSNQLQPSFVSIPGDIGPTSVTVEFIADQGVIP